MHQIQLQLKYPCDFDNNHFAHKQVAIMTTVCRSKTKAKKY